MVVDCYGSSIVGCGLVSPLANGIKTSLIERRSERALDRQVLDLTGLSDNTRKYDHSTPSSILRDHRVNSRDDLRRDYGSRIRRRGFTVFRHTSDGDGRAIDIGYGPIWMAGMICGLIRRGWIGSLHRRRGCAAT
jgi:hypothetical protein